MLTNRLVSLAGTILAIALAPTALAQNYDLPWHTIDGGGGFSAGGTFELDGTIGQSDAGPGALGMTGGNFDLVGGFWAGAATAPTCPGDADGDGDVDISDLGLLLSQFGMSGMGLAGDVDFDGDVDITDLGILLANFGVSCL